jgi:hypothetical protein
VLPPDTGSGGPSALNTQNLVIALMVVLAGAAMTGIGWQLRRRHR